MKKLNLCIDIDGIVTEPYYWIQRANEYFNTSIKPSDVTSYEIHKILKVNEDDFNHFYNLYGKQLHAESIIRVGASKVVNKLYKNHIINFVTAREEKMRDISCEWLNRYQIPMDTISLLGSHNKVSKAEDLECDIFIEDRYENAIQLSEAGFEILLIDCNYNKGILHKNIHRVKNWYQIENLINNRSKQYGVNNLSVL